MTDLRFLFIVMGIVWLALRISEVAKVADDNRRLIAQLEANYAANADFRRLSR